MVNTLSATQRRGQTLLPVPNAHGGRVLPRGGWTLGTGYNARGPLQQRPIRFIEVADDATPLLETGLPSARPMGTDDGGRVPPDRWGQATTSHANALPRGGWMLGTGYNARGPRQQRPIRFIEVADDATPLLETGLPSARPMGTGNNVRLPLIDGDRQQRATPRSSHRVCFLTSSSKRRR